MCGGTGYNKNDPANANLEESRQALMMAARGGGWVGPELMNLATLMVEQRAHSLVHKEVHRDVQRFLRRNEHLTNKEIAGALIAQAAEKKAIRPTWYFYEKIGREILEALR